VRIVAETAQPTIFFVQASVTNAVVAKPLPGAHESDVGDP